MKVSELIKNLQKYPQDSVIDFKINLNRETLDVFDTCANVEIIGSTDTSPEIILVPKNKSTDDYETLTDLLDENPNNIHVNISRSGIYVYSDNELRREIEFKKSYQKVDLSDKIELLIEKLIEII